ncbi:DUF2971 domain-containing protein [Pseudomonas yamanorum]|uniref:DUF2971 domain-containing protein n=1 Tax=Pseudomonas yamanorum TaxID=515393 RepID=UPI003BA1CD8B
MTVEKYLSLLATSRIFLCRLDNFEDTWEGAWPKAFMQGILQMLKERGIDGSTLPTIHKKWLFVSCWHANNYESAAMWDLYSTKRSGVAIRTTIGRLKKSIVSTSEYMIGQVEYLDVESDPRALDFNMLVPAFLKRMSFKHENEVRLVRFDTGSMIEHEGEKRIGDPSPILDLEVDLDELLAEVFFSPAMPGWLVDSIVSVSQKFGLEGDRYTQSKLYDDYIL